MSSPKSRKATKFYHQNQTAFARHGVWKEITSARKTSGPINAQKPQTRVQRMHLAPVAEPPFLFASCRRRME